jgi:putative ABC transport system permease protein
VTRIAESIFAASLYLYPASFRDEYGREMRRLLADSLRHAGGGADAVLVWLQALAGVLLEAPREHGGLMMDDLRHAFRTLRLARWFTLTALLTLALGIGANTAIFSVVEALLLRQLPYQGPDRIVMVWVKNPEQGFDHDITSYPRLEDWRAESRTIEAFSAYDGRLRVLSGWADPEQVRTAMVTADFFRVMGAKPALGSGFSSGDDDFGRPHKAVLSHGLWARRFGADPGIVGRTITMDGQLYTVVGVMPSAFRYPTRETDVWEPLGIAPELRRQRGAFWLTTVARLKPGVRVEQAQQEMDALSRRLAEQYSQDRGLGVDLVTLKDELTAATRPALLVLTAAVAFVLLIACANVAGMLIARASDRQREIALRAALGAGRGRVIRQLLTEGMVLFMMGGSLGLALAAAGVRAIVRLAPPALPQIRDVEVNWTVALYAIGLAAATGLVFGAGPAIQAARRDPADALRAGSPRTTGRRGGAWFGTGLLAAQVALAFVLLSGAALLLRSFAEMEGVDLGFDPRNVVVARISLPSAAYDNATKVVAFYEALTERLSAAPDVESAAGITSLLLSRLPNSAGFQIEGRTQDIITPLTSDTVTPGFFRTLRIPLLRGRFFTDADGKTSQRVTIINQTTSKKYWPYEDPVGKRIRFGAGADNENPWMTIVGVVGDTKRAGLDVPVFTESYQPMRQAASASLAIVVRARTDAAAGIGPAIRAAVRGIDPQQPVSTIAPLLSMLDETVAGRRFNTLLVTIFAVAALVLAAVGVYGLLAYTIAQQDREIGIRMAVGASAMAILKAVGGRAIAAACVGGLAGVALSVAVSRAITGLLFGIAPLDAVSYAAAACVLAAVVAAAAAFPLRRALKVDPAVSLRAE